MVDNANRSVIIACTLRSGSNLLCDWLAKQGIGSPTEFFQVERYQNVESRRQGDVSTLPTVDAVYEEFVASHGGSTWRGVKWSWPQFDAFLRTIGEGGNQPTLEHWLPNPTWIFLTRRDLVAQAVSLYLAERGGVWVHGDPARSTERIEYDFHRILTCFQALAVEQAQWTAYLAANGIPHVGLAFEDLTGSQDGFRRVAAALGVPTIEGGAKPESRHRPIANPLATEFAERFRLDLQGGRHNDDRVRGAVETLLREVRGREESERLARFIGDDAGKFPTVRKIDLRRELKVSGQHAWVERPQFLDGYALRLDAGSKVELTLDARRLMVEMLAHAWSGVCRIEVGPTNDVIDLYHWHQTGRTWTYDAAASGEVTLSIEPSGEKAALSMGTEIWLQQIWALAD